MFVDFNIIYLMFENFNLEELKKNPGLLSEKLDIFVDIILFQSNFILLIIMKLI